MGCCGSKPENVGKAGKKKDDGRKTIADSTAKPKASALQNVGRKVQTANKLMASENGRPGGSGQGAADTNGVDDGPHELGTRSADYASLSIGQTVRRSPGIACGILTAALSVPAVERTRVPPPGR